jgi:murein DD-endopeptidase MepM/ murein hydrolase activator NlpD
VVHVKNYDNSFAGKWIGIDHGNGIYSRYLHNTQNLVQKGDRVSRGQQIATVGQTGTSGAGTPHVHFDVKLADTAHQEYQRRYGTPTTGWGSKMSGFGWGAPAETFMSGVRYKDGGAAAKGRGVVFYKPTGGLIVLAAVALLGAWWAATRS